MSTVENVATPFLSALEKALESSFLITDLVIFFLDDMALLSYITYKVS